MNNDLENGSTDHRSPRGWEAAVAGANPAALLLIAERRMGADLRSCIQPEDILQDALLHAWRDRGAHAWQGSRVFRNWLLSIIDNRIRDARDLHGAVKRGGDATVLSFSFKASSEKGSIDAPESTTPSRIAWYREQAAAIQSAIETLPDELREVVRLRLIEQLQVHEVAQHLGIGASAVRHRFRKGAELFRYRMTSFLGSASGNVNPKETAAREQPISSS